MNQLGNRAVIAGAGMAGLFAARVLAEFYPTVTLVERDRLPPGATQRRGAPQGRHFHVLSLGGARLLEELFPGLLGELAAAGAVVCDDDDLSRLVLQMGGHTLNRSRRFADPSVLVWHLLSRPLLEAHVRRRVDALPGVEIHDGSDVVGPVAESPSRVTGVRVTDRDTGAETVLDADLFVDAMGRGARTPAFLADLGYDRPVEHHAGIRGSYSSQLLQIPAGGIDERLILLGPTPARPIGATLSSYENDTWMLSIGCVDGRRPPRDLAGMLAVFEHLDRPDILAALRAAEPVGPVAVAGHRGVWRRYDKLRASPAGLLVFGDAICSLNPIYGQGMTVALLQAVALRDCLTDPRGNDADLGRRFFRAAARKIRPTWVSNQANDAYVSPTNGRRSPAQRLAAWQIDNTLALAEDDIALTEAIFRVGQFIDPPSVLLGCAARSALRSLVATLRAQVAPTASGARVSVSG